MCTLLTSSLRQEGDTLLWLQPFELNVARVAIPRMEWAKEVLSLLEDGPFLVVSHLGLANSDDYDSQEMSPTMLHA